MVKNENFFKKQTKASKVKAEIVSKYFSTWANVMASQNTRQIAYLDLFSGPGRYDDGNLSTPLLILEKAINHCNFQVSQKVKLIFNDSDPTKIQELRSEISTFPNIEKLILQPLTINKEIGEETIEYFVSSIHVPTLSFIDPCGYKGLSLPLIKALAKDWGCDCIFFFNYRRINPGIENPSLRKPISIVFTTEILEELRQIVHGKTPYERETAIVNKLREVFNGWGMDYFLSFPFKNNSGSRTTHYLIFVSKHILGYNIMKEIMGKLSSCCYQEVPSFEYNPAASRQPKLNLFEPKPLDNLKKMLLKDFAGVKIKMKDIFEKHHIGKPYLKNNYKKALLDLENKNRIKTNRAQRNSKDGTFADEMVVMFPNP